MSPLADRILALLGESVSPINAHAIFRRALAVSGLDASTLDFTHLPRLLPALETSLALFVVTPGIARSVISRLEPAALPTSSRPTTLPLVTEEDLGRARMHARQIAAEENASSFVAQKIATVVSELGRNALKYAGGGSIQLSIVSDPRAVRIVVTDTGSGIPNLDTILAGKHRSRTGMGLGLLGTRRLSKRFEVKTGPEGTRILAEVPL